MTLADNNQRSRHAPKRNRFQIANDRALAIELLVSGMTYTAVAAHISSLRTYSISDEQIRLDVGAFEEGLIAAAIGNSIEAIAVELQRTEQMMENLSQRISALPIDEPKAAPLLKLLADLYARQTYLRAGDCYIKAQDLNAAMDRVQRAGFKVTSPAEHLN